jgi:shikimate kinase
MKWMNKQGITFWIDEPVETLASRLMKEKEHRPLIKDLDDQGLAEFLDKKLAERADFYKQAAFRLTGEELTESTFIKILKEHA